MDLKKIREAALAFEKNYCCDIVAMEYNKLTLPKTMLDILDYVDKLERENKLLRAIKDEVKFFAHWPGCKGGYECTCQLNPVGKFLEALNSTANME